MNKRITFAIAVVTIVSGLVVLGTLSHPRAIAQSQVWEYKVVDVAHWYVNKGSDRTPISEITEFYNKFGDEGWEYVQADSHYYVIFKRPKR